MRARRSQIGQQVRRATSVANDPKECSLFALLSYQRPTVKHGDFHGLGVRPRASERARPSYRNAGGEYRQTRLPAHKGRANCQACWETASKADVVNRHVPRIRDYKGRREGIGRIWVGARLNLDLRPEKKC